MKKKKVLFTSFIIIWIISLLWYILFPWYYIWWDNIFENWKIIVKNIYLKFNKTAKFEEYSNAIVFWFINNDKLNKISYKDIINNKDNLDIFVQQKYKVFYYQWFKLEKIWDNCFIYSNSIKNLEDTYWFNLKKYKKINYNDIRDCDKDCNIYITEKWLLKTDEIYNCN
jgi:hypothetical protein